MRQIHLTCENRSPHVPDYECSDCERLEERVETLEKAYQSVVEELESKADAAGTQEAIDTVKDELDALVGTWIYKGSVNSSAELPEGQAKGDVYYSVQDEGYYVALEDEGEWGYISSLKAVSQTITLQATKWNDGRQSVYVKGVNSDSIVVVSPTPSSIKDYKAYCVEQGTNSLTFEVEEAPEVDLRVNVLILKVGSVERDTTAVVGEAIVGTSTVGQGTGVDYAVVGQAVVG